MNDQSRCYGTNCEEKARCLRHGQIRMDKDRDDVRLLSYTSTLVDRDSGYCQMKIEID